MEKPTIHGHVQWLCQSLPEGIYSIQIHRDNCSIITSALPLPDGNFQACPEDTDSPVVDNLSISP